MTALRSPFRPALRRTLRRGRMHDPAVYSLTELVRQVLYSNGEQGFLLDPSNLASMYQDVYGTTPVTGVEQPVGLMLDTRFGLERGPELKGEFSTAGIGSETSSSTYDPDTGEGYAKRVDSTNQSFVYLPTVVVGKCYEITIVNNGPGRINIRTNSSNTTTLGLSSGETGTCVVNASGTGSGRFRIQMQSDGAEATFVIVSCREIPGNHFYQATSSSRPTLRARYNELLYSTDPADSAWANVSTLTAEPAGSMTADGITFSAARLISGGTLGGYRSRTMLHGCTAGVPVYALVYSKPGSSGNFRVSFRDSAADQQSIYGGPYDAPVSVSNSAGDIVLLEHEEIGGGVYRTFVIWTPNSTAGSSNTTFRFGPATSNAGEDVIFLGAHVQTNPYGGSVRFQRITTATDYDTDGFPPYLVFDGADDTLVSTQSIDFTATDEMTVWAGARKLQHTNTSNMAELSTSVVSNTGAFYLRDTNSSGTPGVISFGSKGTGDTVRASGTAMASPASFVVSGQGKISAPYSTTRVNGIQTGNSTATQGGGNYGNYPLYVGSRAGSSLMFSGYLYYLAVRALETSVEDISLMERLIASKMGGSL